MVQSLAEGSDGAMKDADGDQSATLTNFVVATNEFRGTGVAERAEYHNLVAWD